LKKLLSIFLLLVAIFNLGGYGLFMAHLEDKANEKMEQQIDGNAYEASQLISIKIPLTNLPYYTNSADYKRQDGHIEVQGIVYNYVKERIYNDSLEMLCIPNSEATTLLTAKDDFFKLSNELQKQGKKPAPVAKAFKFFSPYYWFNNIVLKQSMFAVALQQQSSASVIRPVYYTSNIEDPPDFC
jgi:hypothetical protein